MNTGSQPDDVFHDAQTLSPNDRLRLIARLWASLPADHWAAPSPRDLAELRGMLGDVDTERIGEVPWKVVRQMAGVRASTPASKIYSVPRRFDLATIFVVTAAYSLGLGLLRACGTPPIVVFYIGVFVTLVAIAQALLFGGAKPRLASVITGILGFFLGMLTLPLVGRFHIGDPLEQIAFAMVFSVPFGSLFGYIAGTVVGGVFLVADSLRSVFERRRTGSIANVDLSSEQPESEHERTYSL